MAAHPHPEPAPDGPALRETLRRVRDDGVQRVAGSELHDLLTTGYAHALHLEAEREALARRHAEVTAELVALRSDLTAIRRGPGSSRRRRFPRAAAPPPDDPSPAAS